MQLSVDWCKQLDRDSFLFVFVRLLDVDYHQEDLYRRRDFLVQYVFQ